MKKSIPNVFTKSDKIICRLSGLFLCLILSMNLSAQKIQTLKIETWTAGNFVNSSLQTFTYDGSGFLTNVLTQIWVSSAWQNSAQSNYSNNLDGTANIVTTQSWNGSSWDNVTQTTYTYNGAKKVLTATSQIWLVAIWQNASMQTNTYNGSGFLINSLFQTWLVSTWQNSSRTKYTNNVNGTVNIDTMQIWDGVSTWKNSERSTFTYTGSNKVLTDATDTLRAGNWAQYTKETNTYDGSGFLTNSLNQRWDAVSTTYKNDTQSNYTNNTNGTPSVVIFQQWDGVSAWVNSERLTYTYEPPTRVPELKSDQSFTVYPNPAGDQILVKGNISIDGSTYSITDQTGKLVLKGKLINQNGTIDISALANGIYFLRIGEKNQNVIKVIKNK